MNTLISRSVLVLGTGESGLAMARWCASQGARVRIADSREQPPAIEQVRERLPQVDIRLGAFSPQLLDGIDLLAVSPGIDDREPLLEQARHRGIAIVGEMSLFAQALAALQVREHTRILAITGTNGKTTVTALTAALCSAGGIDAVAAGNISPAALTVLLERLERGQALPECWVLELSSFQLEHAEGFRADAATVLNVSEDHLDRHENIGCYAAVKARIFSGDGVQVINRGDTQAAAMIRPGRQVVSFGLDAPPDENDFGLLGEDDAPWLARGDERLIAAAALPLAGRHNLLNAQAALALAGQVVADMPTLLEAMRQFRGLPHRVEAIARREDGVIFYDDSKGTNIGATDAALSGLGRPVVLIAGGVGKGQDFSLLRAAVADHAAAVVLIGRDAPLIEQALAGTGVTIENAGDMEDAVRRANRLTRPGMAVLLSPACASFDMFTSYAHRAEVFRAAVLHLPGVTES